MRACPRVPLKSALDALEALHGRPPKPIPRAPFAWIVWENVAYLVDDERRAAVYRALEKRTALDPRRIGLLSDDEEQKFDEEFSSISGA